MFQLVGEETPTICLRETRTYRLNHTPNPEMKGFPSSTLWGLGHVPAVCWPIRTVPPRNSRSYDLGLINLGGGFKYFLFLTLFGEMIHFD